MGMNNREVEAWLARIPVLTRLPADSENEVMELIGHKGLAALIGLVFGERQGLYAQLSLYPLDDDAHRYRAAVLQGKIQGIESFINTVRECAVSSSGEEESRRSQ